MKRNIFEVSADLAEKLGSQVTTVQDLEDMFLLLPEDADLFLEGINGLSFSIEQVNITDEGLVFNLTPESTILKVSEMEDYTGDVTLNTPVFFSNNGIPFELAYVEMYKSMCGDRNDLVFIFERAE